MRYRQSNLKNYFTCPRKFLLSMQHDFGEPSMAMRQGLIFENLVLGNKANHDEAEFKKNVIGRITPATLETIRNHADTTKAELGEGIPFVDLAYQMNHAVLLTGEADFIGMVLVEDKVIRAIVDLKYTGDLIGNWSGTERSDYLQAFQYMYIWERMTGERLPFVYKLVDNSADEAMIKTLVINPTDEDFQWFEGFIKGVSEDIYFEPCEEPETCLGWKGRQKCQYLRHCPYGTNLVFGTKYLSFNNKLTDLISSESDNA